MSETPVPPKFAYETHPSPAPLMSDEFVSARKAPLPTERKVPLFTEQFAKVIGLKWEIFQLLTSWRREWDSNPRYGFPYTRFPSERLQPLGHPSGRAQYSCELCS